MIYSQEVKARRKMLEKLIQNLTKKVEKDHEPSAWNPGGSKVIQRTSERLELYRKLAKKKNLQKLKQKSTEIKVKQLHDHDERLNKKMGLFRKANVYYAKEMYNDAFKTIVKAIEIVKREYEAKEDADSKKAGLWKSKLGLPPGTSVSYDELLAPETEGNTSRSEAEGTRAKLWILAEKTGLLGKKPVDVNAYLNYQIEQTYKKIQKALSNKAKDVEILKKTIEKLEERPPADADPYDIERKIDHMTQAIEVKQKRNVEGKPPVAWQPTSAKDAILKVEDYDTVLISKLFMRNPERAKKKLEKTDLLHSKFYEKDIENLAKMPFDDRP